MSKDEREPLFASERRRKILEMIETHKKVTVPQLSELFSVSAATIRNDLRELRTPICSLEPTGSDPHQDRDGARFSGQRRQKSQEKTSSAEKL